MANAGRTFGLLYLLALFILARGQNTTLPPTTTTTASPTDAPPTTDIPGNQGLMLGLFITARENRSENCQQSTLSL